MDLQKWNEIMNYSAASGLAAWTSDIRKKEYENDEVSTDDMIVALWEAIVENRPAAMNELQAKRLAVKKKYPKQTEG